MNVLSIAVCPHNLRFFSIFGERICPVSGILPTDPENPSVPSNHWL